MEKMQLENENLEKILSRVKVKIFEELERRGELRYDRRKPYQENLQKRYEKTTYDKKED